MEADAIVGIDIDYSMLGSGIMMVVVNGVAVKLELLYEENVRH